MNTNLRQCTYMIGIKLKFFQCSCITEYIFRYNWQAAMAFIDYFNLAVTATKYRYTFEHFRMLMGLKILMNDKT